MKKIITVLIIMCLFLTGCSKSSLNEDRGVYQVVLNNKSNTFKITEEETNSNKKQVTITMNDTEILNYTRVYTDGYQYDKEKVSLVKGKDNKSYLVYAVGNWTGSKYDQYLYIFNENGTVIYHIDDKNFGAAFTDYTNIEELHSIYGDTGMVKVEEDKIIYLNDFNYSDSIEYSRCQENIITIKNDEITEQKGNIIKAAKVA